MAARWREDNRVSAGKAGRQTVRVVGRVVDLYSESGLREIMLKTGFRYALTIGGLDDKPMYVLRGVPEDIAVHVSETVSVLGVELDQYDLHEYAVLKCTVIEELP